MAGFKMPFLKNAVLPDWWDKSCEADLSLLPELEIRASRFLGLPLSEVRDPTAPLSLTANAAAKLRHSRSVNPENLHPAIHAGIAIAGAVVRNLRHSNVVVPPPSDPMTWWESLSATGSPTLETVTRDLWDRGIPVVHVEHLPSPKFQGMACIAEHRPVILLAHLYDQPVRLVYHLAHEAAHVAYGDCEPGSPVVEVEETFDRSDMEVRADRFAWVALTGAQEVPQFRESSFRELANEADKWEGRTGVDAALAIWSWGNRTGDFQTAMLALKALYVSHGGKAILRQQFDENVAVEDASESDRTLLSCVHGDSTHDAIAY